MNETGPEIETGQAPAERENELEGLYGLTDDLVRDIRLAVQEERREDIPSLVADLHAADLADLLEHLGSTDRIVVIQAIGDTLDAANISYNLLKVLGDGLSVGPILLGMARPIHILTPSVTTRGIVNMSALAVVDAQAEEEDSGRIR